MKNIKIDSSLCKSVFKNGENTTTKTQFTKKWIELINTIEKDNSFKF